jgi:hypothetical protein
MNNGFCYFPGAYLYRTRLGSAKAALGYLWLEVLPWLCVLFPLAGNHALLYPLGHFCFIGLYEIGYWRNDEAKTASETARGRVPALDWRAFLSIRLAVLLGGAVAVCLFAGPMRALFYVCACVGVLLLLLLHTKLGLISVRGSPWRWLVFAWLTQFKYFPALLASAPYGSVPVLIAIGFLCYGGGRLLEYAVVKHGGGVIGTLGSMNLVWFIAATPLVFLLAYQMPGRLPLLFWAAVGSYHLCSCLAKLLSQRRGCKLTL